jgi:drug/metabolite transporter (DMT)-like permease
MGMQRLSSSRTLGPDLAALLVVFIWGVNFVFVKAALAELNVLAFVAVRYLAMLVVGWAVVAWRRPGRAAVTGALKDWRQLLVAAGLGFSLYIPLSMVGLNYTTAFANALLIALAPLFMAVLLALFSVESISRAHLGGLGVALLGTAVFVSDALGAGSAALTAGDLISLLAAVFYAGYNVANKPLVSRHPATLVTTLTLTAGAVPVILLFAPGLFAQDWTRVTWIGIAALAFSAVFPVYFAWAAWGWANARVGVARTSLFMYLVPVFGGVASWLLLGEAFDLRKIAGAALILGGLALARVLASLRRPREMRSPAPTA